MSVYLDSHGNVSGCWVGVGGFIAGRPNYCYHNHEVIADGPPRERHETKKEGGDSTEGQEGAPHRVDLHHERYAGRAVILLLDAMYLIWVRYPITNSPRTAATAEGE